MQRFRFDLSLPPQHIAWGDYLAAATAADDLTFETFWTWDHLLPISGNPHGSEFECYTTMAALAQATKRVRIGALVSGVVYRNPALQIKMATQIDVISNGRFDFGIGAAWAAREFRRFDIPFPPPRERIAILRETLHLAKLLWSGDPHREITYDGRYVHARDLSLNPQPVQRPHPPILVGGGGEQLTLRVAAHYADIWHGFDDPLTLKRKVDLLDRYAPTYGRDGRDIAKSTTVSIWVGGLRGDSATRLAQATGLSPEELRNSFMYGDPSDIERQLRTYVDVGITHFVVNAIGIDFVDNWKRICDEIVPRFSSVRSLT